MTVITGQVVRGNQIGRTIGFPTANLLLDYTEQSLSKGVYGVKVWYNNHQYEGIMNVGVRPTISKEDLQVHYEVHILHFDQMIYGEELKVEVCYFVRAEIRFDSLEQLVLQIKEDVVCVENRLKVEYVN